MENNKTEKNEQLDNNFYIGITMAGAISAGAYSAGVIDFLIFALNEWEKQKKIDRESGSNRNEAPVHQVVIPVVSGASAGSIVGAIAFPLIPDEIKIHQTIYEEIGKVEYCLPKLFDAWVKLTAFTHPNHKNELFGLDDLQKNSKVTSLLNSDVLDEVIKTIFSFTKESNTTYPFISSNLHLFFTHSNLRGIPYKIEMTGGTANQPGYSMTMHADRVHYVVNGIGQHSFASPWLDTPPSDEFITLDVNNLNSNSIPHNWLSFAEAAIGSGAFPVGLKARIIATQSPMSYENRSWPNVAESGSFKLPTNCQYSGSLPYATVDGGLFNNEPFELCRWALMANPPYPNKRNEGDSDSKYVGKVDRAVVTIDPFADADKLADYDPDVSLIKVILKMLPAIKSNARFKPAEALALLDEEVYSRYLIAPRRYSENRLEEFAIACGLVDGFGGFLSEKFRAHDYQLGRRNCYDFLKRHLALPEGFSVVDKGYKDVETSKRGGFVDGASEEGAQKNWLPVIPLVGGAKVQPELMKWPKVTKSELEYAVNKASIRANKLFSKLLREHTDSWWIKRAFELYWFFSGKRKIKKFIMSSIYSDLVKRQQMEN